MIVILTTEQAESLKGIEFVTDNFFNPIQDLNNNWVISDEEQNQCDIKWLKDLPKSEYFPKITTNFL
jgi:hypothetical protein